MVQPLLPRADDMHAMAFDPVSLREIPYADPRPAGFTGKQVKGPKSQYANNQKYGLNPATGKYEPLFVTHDWNNLDDPHRYFLESDSNRPKEAKPFEYSIDRGTLFDNVMQMVPGAMTAFVTGGLLSGAGAAGAGAAGSGIGGAGGATLGFEGGLGTGAAAGGSAIGGGLGGGAAAAGGLEGVGATAYPVASSAGPTISGIATGADPFVSTGLGASAASGFNAAAGGGGILDWLGSTASNYLPGEASTGAGSAGIGMGDLFKAGGNFLINQFQANRAQHQASDLMSQQNPLNQSERKPFQAQANELMLHPEKYLQNNPFAKSVADRYKNFIIPSQFAQSGNAGEVLDRNGSQFVNAISGNYNNLLQQMATFGGYNQGPGSNGVAQLMMQGNKNFGESFRGLGDVTEKLFGNVSKPGSSGNMVSSFPENPITNSTTYFA